MPQFDVRQTGGRPRAAVPQRLIHQRKVGLIVGQRGADDGFQRIRPVKFLIDLLAHLLPLRPHRLRRHVKQLSHLIIRPQPLLVWLMRIGRLGVKQQKLTQHLTLRIRQPLLLLRKRQQRTRRLLHFSHNESLDENDELDLGIYCIIIHYQCEE